MTIWVYSGIRPSNGAKELSKFPGFKRLRVGKFVKAGDIFVNWGTSAELDGLINNTTILNKVEAVKTASNKLTAFELFCKEQVKSVPWCAPEDEDCLMEWQEQKATIIGRQTLTGHSGHGIIIMGPGEPIQPALLYTKYIFKVHEYRVHVVCGAVVDTQMKIRDPHKVPLSWKVRSHENGFIFARNNVSVSPERDKLAIDACAALGLDFGAVDIVEDKNGCLYVLEANTAPGLEGQTITSYADAFRGACNVG